MAGAGRMLLGAAGAARKGGNKAFDSKVSSLESMIEKAKSGKAFDEDRYMMNRNAAIDMAGRYATGDMTAAKVKRMFPTVAELRKMAKEAKSSMDSGEMEKMIKGLDPKELGLTKRESDGIRKHKYGGTSKPKKMNMGGQMQNRFTKKDYRKGGLFR
jgi:hypothetical protein